MGVGVRSGWTPRAALRGDGARRTPDNRAMPERQSRGKTGQVSCWGSSAVALSPARAASLRRRVGRNKACEGMQAGQRSVFSVIGGWLSSHVTNQTVPTPSEHSKGSALFSESGVLHRLLTLMAFLACFLHSGWFCAAVPAVPARILRTPGNRLRCFWQLGRPRSRGQA